MREGGGCHRPVVMSQRADSPVLLVLVAGVEILPAAAAVAVVGGARR